MSDAEFLAWIAVYSVCCLIGKIIAVAYREYKNARAG